MSPFSLLLAFLFAKPSGATSPAAPTRERRPRSAPSVPAATVPAASTTPPWPAAVPSDLPAWPGSGWVPDVPIGPGVSKRAAELLRELWARGLGAHKTERVAGRWITFVARRHGQKKAVEAYRVAADTSPVTVVTDVVVNRPEPSPVGLPILKKGMKGPDVTTLQRSFGWSKVTDFFGDQTHKEVIKRQSAAGLPATGIVDAKTWAMLLGQTGVTA